MRAITVHVNILEIGEHKGTLEQLETVLFSIGKTLILLVSLRTTHTFLSRPLKMYTQTMSPLS